MREKINKNNYLFTNKMLVALILPQIMVLFIALFSALATGGAVVAGQYLGMKKEKEACRSSTQLVWFSTITAIVIMIIIYVGKYLILHVIFGPIDADVRAHANTYLMIVTASIPFIAFTMAGLQSSGHKVTLRYPCVYPS